MCRQHRDELGLAQARSWCESRRFGGIGRHQHQNGNPNSPMVENLEQTLPAKYNVKMRLHVDIHAEVQIHDLASEK